MAIILPQDHPAFHRLQSQNVAVKADTPLNHVFGAASAGDNVVNTAFVNLMPESYLDETMDLLLARLSRAQHDVRPIFVHPNEPKKGITWAEANQKYAIDAVMITGYAASNADFDELSFIDGAREILDDTAAKKLPLFAVCAGAMLAANHYYGVSKVPATRAPTEAGGEPEVHKYLGYLPFSDPQGDVVLVPTSRQNTLEANEFAAAVKEFDLSVPLVTHVTLHPEPAVFTDPANNRIFTLSHFEYQDVKSRYKGFEDEELDILTYQYKRDQASGDAALMARVQPPINPDPTPAEKAKLHQYSESLFQGFVSTAASVKAERAPAQDTLISYGLQGADLASARQYSRAYE